MGVQYSSTCYYQSGSNRVVKSISASQASTLSRWSVKDKPLRGYDEETKELEHAPITDIRFYPDSIKMYHLRTEDDYQIDLTEDTEVLTFDGWKKVEDLAIDDIIMENGMEVPPYAQKDVLELLYVQKGKTQKEIAQMYGVSPRTIRGYVDKFNLHRGDQGAKFGEENPNWRGINVSKDGGYSRTHNITDKTKKGICDRCGFRGATQIHHDDRNPTNTDDENLIELCVMCHKAEHLGAPVRWIRPARITEKRTYGYEKSCGFNTSLGNVVVNGFILRFPKDGAQIKVIEGI